MASTIIFFWLNKFVCFFCSYISSRYQRCKINNSFSQWKIFLTGVSEGSNLRPLLFNVFYWWYFLFFSQKCVLSNYADDNIMYSSDKKMNDIMTLLNHDFAIASNCFYKFLWSSILINVPLYYLVLRTNLK